jgi:hypothetical protein
MEGLAPFQALPKVGASILIINGVWSFAINVAGVYLIHSAGSLVLTLSGILKVGRGNISCRRGSTANVIIPRQNILLVVMSVLLLGSAVSAPQVIGQSACSGSPCRATLLSWRVLGTTGYAVALAGLFAFKIYIT